MHPKKRVYEIAEGTHVQQTVIIKTRFNGPPKSGNGGYVSGLLGTLFEGPAEVSLHSPPPLDEPLVLAREGDKATLVHGDELVGSAVAKELELAVPNLPAPFELGIDPVDAPGAPGLFKPFSSCFVCGQDRTQGDGLCIHSKQLVGHEGLVGAHWQLDDSLKGADGYVDPLYIWSALDCPGYFACAAGEGALLGRLTAQTIKPLKAGGSAKVMAWDLTDPAAKGGRKRRCGSAVFDSEGMLVAKAEGLWITIDPSKLAV